MGLVFFDFRFALNLVEVILILCHFGLINLFWMIFQYFLFVFFLCKAFLFRLINDCFRFSINRWFRYRLILEYFRFTLLYFFRLFSFLSILWSYLFTWWLQRLFRLFTFLWTFGLRFIVNVILMTCWTLRCWLFDTLFFFICLGLLRLSLGIWRNLAAMTWTRLAWLYFDFFWWLMIFLLDFFWCWRINHFFLMFSTFSFFSFCLFDLFHFLLILGQLFIRSLW